MKGGLAVVVLIVVIIAIAVAIFTMSLARTASVADDQAEKYWNEHHPSG